MKNSRLRIAQVSPLWTRIPPTTYGGIELVMKLLIDELVARGHEVTLFSSGDCATSAHLHETVDRNLTARVITGETEMFEHYANSTMAEVMGEAGRFDLIHYHLSTAWLPLAGAVRTPGLFTMHSSPRVDDEWAMGRWPEVEVAGISTCQMHAAGLKLEREFPVVYNGADFASFEPRFEPGSHLAFLGRLSADKNPLGAIRIAQEVGMPLVIAGQPQNQKEAAYFKSEVEPLIDGEQIRWIGPVNHAQKNELLRHAAALLFPIQWEEPFGLVMIEAMACGTPVVAHRRGSVEEVVDDGVTGYTSGSMDALPELVAPALALNREHVRARAEARFGHRRMVDDYLALYRALIER
ncbi:MAG: glycosyltransferase family 4 protein [Chthoniobacter sp.]|nr:glycosyltransferase family 4 protein [Chthoniobacter sp.]